MENIALDDLYILNSMMFQNCRSEEFKETTLTEFARTLRKMADFCSTNLNWDIQTMETKIMKELGLKVIKYWMCCEVFYLLVFFGLVAMRDILQHFYPRPKSHLTFI